MQEILCDRNICYVTIKPVQIHVFMIVCMCLAGLWKTRISTLESPWPYHTVHIRCWWLILMSYPTQLLSCFVGAWENFVPPPHLFPSASFFSVSTSPSLSLGTFWGRVHSGILLVCKLFHQKVTHGYPMHKDACVLTKLDSRHPFSVSTSVPALSCLPQQQPPPTSHPPPPATELSLDATDFALHGEWVWGSWGQFLGNCSEVLVIKLSSYLTLSVTCNSWQGNSFRKSRKTTQEWLFFAEAQWPMHE